MKQEAKTKRCQGEIIRNFWKEARLGQVHDSTTRAKKCMWPYSWPWRYDTIWKSKLQTQPEKRTGTQTDSLLGMHWSWFRAPKSLRHSFLEKLKEEKRRFKINISSEWFLSRSGREVLKRCFFIHFSVFVSPLCEKLGMHRWRLYYPRPILYPVALATVNICLVCHSPSWLAAGATPPCKVWGRETPSGLT